MLTADVMGWPSLYLTVTQLVQPWVQLPANNLCQSCCYFSLEQLVDSVTIWTFPSRLLTAYHWDCRHSLLI